MQHTFADGKYADWMLVDYDKMKEERDELLEALQAMCAEFRGHDLPYGSKAYANAVSLINNNPTR